MYVCVCVCSDYYVCMYVSMYAYMHRLVIQLQNVSSVGRCDIKYVCMYVCVCVCSEDAGIVSVCDIMYVCMYACMYVCIYVYVLLL